MVVAIGGGAWGLLFDGNWVREDEKSSGDGGDSCTTVGRYFMLLTCVLENG